MREFIYCAKAGCTTRANAATGYCPHHRTALAAATGTAKTAELAECEASQSGGEAATPKTNDE